jgi:hypothetical protein
MHPRDYKRAFAADADVIDIGKLDLPSGSVVACDPYFCASAHPFSRHVPAGKYEVQVCRKTSPEWGERIALARLHILPDVNAVAFEPATRGVGDAGRFFVDSGIASYMDDVTRVVFAEHLANYYRSHPDGNYYADVIEAELKKSSADPDNPLDSGKWTLHRVPGTELTVAMFASGLGDGWYTSWWGLSESGDVVSLVTDFGLS